jgi:hypothetical protein
MIINPRSRIPGMQGDPVEVWERNAHRENPPGSASSLQSDIIRRENLLGTSSSIPGSASSMVPGSRDNLAVPSSAEGIRESMIPGSRERMIPGSHTSFHSAHSTLRRDVPPRSENSISTSLPHLGGGDFVPTASSLSSAHSHNVYASPAASLPNSQNLGGYPGTSSTSATRHQQAGTDTRFHWGIERITRYLLPYREYAHSGEDINLLARVLELCRVSEADSETAKLLLRAIKFLRLCDYSSEDICSTLAHATAYFVDAFSLCGNQMDSCEVGNVLTTLMFIAHCYVQDETCPLHVWHQHLFQKYCPLRTLNVAIVRLMEIRRYVLRLEQDDFDRRYFSLLQASQKQAAFELKDPPRHIDVELSGQAVSPTRASQPPEEQGADALLSRLLENFRMH